MSEEKTIVVFLIVSLIVYGIYVIYQSVLKEKNK